MFLDEIDERKCIVTEIVKRNVPSGIQYSGDIGNGLQNVSIYPSTYVAISRPVKDAIMKIIRIDDNWTPNSFAPHYSFECHDFSSSVGIFGFRETEKGKSIFYLDEEMHVDTSRLWTAMMDTMIFYPNEVLKNLILDEPVDEINLKPISSLKTQK